MSMRPALPNDPSTVRQVPHVSRQDYSLLDISDDGFVRRHRPRAVSFLFLSLVS